VEDAPQLELIRRAELVITHGGLNTVLETLLEGKPMVAIPMAHDQPAVAARLSRLKVAEVLPIERISAASLRSMLTKVLNDPSYRNAAIEIQGKISSIQGLKIAADAIEQALERCARKQSAGAEVIHQSIPVGAESCVVSETQAVKATLDRRALIGQADR
jgi:UDP:flavonoid glycosyltransferase YjiC (YdhE family)